MEPLRTVRSTLTDIANGVVNAASSVAAAGGVNIGALGAKVSNAGGSSAASLRSGDLQALARRSKHKVFTAMGRIEPSQDSVYETKRRIVGDTHRIMTEITAEFAAFITHTKQMSEHYDRLCELLAQFRATCDGHICHESTEDSDVSDSEYVNVGTSGSNASEDKSDPRVETPESAAIEASQRQLRVRVAQAEETLHTNCVVLLQTTAATLVEEAALLHRGVEARGVEFDLARNELEHASRDVAKAKVALDGQTPLPAPASPATPAAATATTAPTLERRGSGVTTPTSAPQPAAEWERSAHVGAAAAAMHWDPNAARALQKSLDASADILARRSREALAQGNEYKSALRDAKRRLHWLLEQASMASWSAFNILFSEMQTLWGDSGAAVRPAAKAIIGLKNAQCVAKALDKERKERLGKHRAEGERRVAAAAAAAAAGAAPPASALAARTMETGEGFHGPAPMFAQARASQPQWEHPVGDSRATSASTTTMSAADVSAVTSRGASEGNDASGGRPSLSHATFDDIFDGFVHSRHDSPAASPSATRAAPRQPPPSEALLGASAPAAAAPVERSPSRIRMEDLFGPNR